MNSSMATCAQWKKKIAANRTQNFNFMRATAFVTVSVAVLSSIFFERLLTCGTNLHTSKITLAAANVNIKQPVEAFNG